MKSNTEWQKWGERDPLWAVATWAGKERGGANPWTDEEFYGLGRSDWEDFCSHWQQYGVKAGHCIEIGCGAGRMTMQLSGHFHRVTALDVSQHQVDYAKSRISARNVEFVVTDGTTIPLGDGTCDAAFSCHVFQHFNSHEDAFNVFRELYRVLASGGQMMIHLPIYKLPESQLARFFPPLISFSRWLSDLKAGAQRRMLRKGKWRPLIKVLRFERPHLADALHRLGFTQIQFRAFPVRSNGGYHDFVFATKKA